MIFWPSLDGVCCGDEHVNTSAVWEKVLAIFSEFRHHSKWWYHLLSWLEAWHLSHKRVGSRLMLQPRLVSPFVRQVMSGSLPSQKSSDVLCKSDVKRGKMICVQDHKTWVELDDFRSISCQDKSRIKDTKVRTPSLIMPSRTGLTIVSTAVNYACGKWGTGA